jgi:putative oxidoreductase
LGLLALRIFVGIGMLTHGFPKLMMLLSGKIEFINFFGIGVKTSLILAVLAEVLCSLFVLMGLFTRFTVIPLLLQCWLQYLLYMETILLPSKKWLFYIYFTTSLFL